MHYFFLFLVSEKSQNTIKRKSDKIDLKNTRIIDNR